MQSCSVKLNTIAKIKAFVEALKAADGHFTLTSGRYVIDAKSIMGIFSLDLSKPVELKADNGVIPDTVKPFLA